MSDLREDLESLEVNPGWLWLKQTELADLRDQQRRWMKQAVNEPNDTMALNKLRQVAAAIDAIERVFARPTEKLHELTAQARQASQPPSLSRRGPL